MVRHINYFKKSTYNTNLICIRAKETNTTLKCSYGGSVNTTTVTLTALLTRNAVTDGAHFG